MPEQANQGPGDTQSDSLTEESEEIRIELRPHYGSRSTRRGEVTVELAQYMIFACGGEQFKQMREGRSEELIGFVGKKPGDAINFLKVVLVFGPEAKAAFELQVRQQLVAQLQASVEQARSSVDEASALLKEADAFLIKNPKSREAKEAVEIAEAAVKSAQDEEDRRLSQLQGEQESERKSSSPDPVKVAAVEADRKAGKLYPKPGGSDDYAITEASKQNL